MGPEMLAAAGSLTLASVARTPAARLAAEGCDARERPVPQLGAGLRGPALDHPARAGQLPLDRAPPVRDDIPPAAHRLGRGGAADRLDALEPGCRPLSRVARGHPRRAALAEARALALGRTAGCARREGRLRRRRAAGDESRERGTGAIHPRAIAEGARAASFRAAPASSRREVPIGTATTATRSHYGSARSPGQAHVHRRRDRGNAAAPHARHRREHG